MLYITNFIYMIILLISCFSEHKNFVNISYISFVQGVFNEINISHLFFGMPITSASFSLSSSVYTKYCCPSFFMRLKLSRLISRRSMFSKRFSSRISKPRAVTSTLTKLSDMNVNLFSLGIFV